VLQPEEQTPPDDPCTCVSLMRSATSHTHGDIREPLLQIWLPHPSHAVRCSRTGRRSLAA
jgi:hypothetical protein